MIGSLPPRAQFAAVSQSKASIIGLDSMTHWLETDLSEFSAILCCTQLLFLTREELSMLSMRIGESWISTAQTLLGKHLRLKGIIVKAGRFGAAFVTRNHIVERPAVSVVDILDPSGAGDALAGALLGACSQAERFDDEFISGPALRAGLDSAAAAISSFGISALI